MAAHEPALGVNKEAGTSATGVDAGAAGVLPPTSKNVYDKVMVVTSLESLGSITKATGHSFFSPGSKVYWLKQKHSILLK
jgi:hypothetical protein